MTPALSLHRVGAAFTLLMLSACGSGEPVGPDPITGTIVVTIVTQGTPIDPAPYSVTVDGGNGRVVQTQGSLTIGGVAAGTRVLALSGWRFNCSPTSPVSHQVALHPGGTAAVDFAVECTQAPQAGRGRELAFTSARAGSREVYRVNDDGTGVIRLAASTTLEDMPAWSPDGARIAYRARIAHPCCAGLTDPEIILMNPDGTGKVNLTNAPESAEIFPSWHPGGATILFQRSPTNVLPPVPPAQLYGVDVDGTGLDSVTSGLRGDWSPDGTRLVIADSHNGSLDLIVVNTDGTGRTPLVATTVVNEQEPDWSPDGTQVAFASNMTGRYEIYAINVDGSGLVQLTDEGEGDRREPAWSPDGSRLALTWQRGDSSDVYVMTNDGSSLSRLTYGGGSQPSWRP